MRQIPKQLIGLVLNLIPFIGGSIASVISVGVDVFEPFAVDDGVTFGLEMNKRAIMGSVWRKTFYSFWDVILVEMN